MLSSQTLELYRQMTPSDRLALTFQAIRDSQRFLVLGSAEIVGRRFERIRQENDARNRRMLERLADAEQNS